MSTLASPIDIAASGMRAQSERIRVAAQNIANVDSTSMVPGGDPYRRKTITFQNVLDKEMGVEKVKVAKIGRDPSAFKQVYQPGHPAANAEGYVLLPNVDTMIESQDLKEAQRSYEANLSTIQVTKTMLGKTLDLLR